MLSKCGLGNSSVDTTWELEKEFRLSGPTADLYPESALWQDFPGGFVCPLRMTFKLLLSSPKASRSLFYDSIWKRVNRGLEKNGKILDFRVKERVRHRRFPTG